MATSFMRKIYSVHDDEKPEVAAETENLDNVSYSNHQYAYYTGVNSEHIDDDEDYSGRPSSAENEQASVRKEIESRQLFNYTYGRFWCLKRFDKKCCLCCRANRKREDFLYIGAQKKLNEELDILEIVKKLRVH